MQILHNNVVAFHYSLRDDQGNEIDSSAGQLPMLYLHGHDNIIPGLEIALEGHSSGDKFDVTVQPEVGYGEYDPELVQTLAFDVFEDIDSVSVGMEFMAETLDGEIPVRVTAIGEDSVTVDGNHPLAGQRLHFTIDVRNVRPSSPEEQSLGYADPDTLPVNVVAAE